MLDVKRIAKGLRLGAAVLILALSFGSITTATAADISPEKRAAIDELMEVSKAKNMMDQIMPQMLQSFEKLIAAQNPGKDHEIASILTRYFGVSFDSYKDDFYEGLYIVYDRHLSVDDIKAMTEFYKTPAGQRILAALPQITQEAMSVGMVFGQQAGREALEKAKADLEAAGIKSPI
jgi:hypothetical protein